MILLMAYHHLVVTFFRVPLLTGGNVLLYGSDAGAPDSTTYYLSGETC
jgi:hypothetical protein